MRKQNIRRTDNHKLPKHTNRIYKYTNTNQMYEADVKLEPEYLELREELESLQDLHDLLVEDNNTAKENLLECVSENTILREENKQYDKLREGLVEEYMTHLLSL